MAFSSRADEQLRLQTSDVSGDNKRVILLIILSDIKADRIGIYPLLY